MLGEKGLRCCADVMFRRRCRDLRHSAIKCYHQLSLTDMLGQIIQRLCRVQFRRVPSNFMRFDTIEEVPRRRFSQHPFFYVRYTSGEGGGVQVVDMSR